MASAPTLGLPQDFLDAHERNELPNFAELQDYEDFSRTAFVPIIKDKTVQRYKYRSFMVAEALQGNEDDRDGHYLIEYVDFCTCRTALVVWYPQLECFGTMDRDHGYHLFACKDVTWNDISKQAGKYLVGKWDWEEGWAYILDPRKEEAFAFVPKET